ncbi:MAG: S9 family peptidase [Propionibacteriaceae bacterium]|jgi:oligopeptidase B|nr:S9 family peptidase [Propionibacteriaceae bacterium]
MLTPSAPRTPRRRIRHGDEFIDPYAWMKDTDSPELLAYLEAENAYCAALSADSQPLADEIYAEITARTQQTDLSVPNYVTHSDGRTFWYYARTTEGLDYPSYFRVPATDRADVPLSAEALSGEELVFDAEATAAGTEFFSLGLLDVSPDGNRVAYSVDTSGAEHYDLHFLDLASRQQLGPVVTDVAAGGAWLGNSAFCYLRLDESWRPDRVYLHRLDQAQTRDDPLILAEDDERFWLQLGQSRDQRWVVIQAGSKTTSECWLLDSTAADPRPRSFCARREGLEYDLEILGSTAYIIHNEDAVDFALSKAAIPATWDQPAGSPLTSTADWQLVIPGRQGFRPLDVSAYDNAVVLSYRSDALARVAVAGPDPASAESFQEIEMAESIFTLEADGGEDPDTDRIRLCYQSMVTPEQLFDYVLETGERLLLKRRPVLDHPVKGSYRPEDYTQTQEWATAPDGTLVPISIVRRADLPLDGSAGCLLYGYGAYEISVAPSFSIARLSLLDRGYSQAIAHVRGGGELGRSWYDAGKLRRKTNTFTDFVACARHLIQAGYASPSRLGIEGGSAGGLLIGAALNLAPETFGAAHAAVPFVDPLNTLLDPQLPLTVTEWEEWGDPLHDAEDYQLIKSYAPYEQLRAVRYPPLLVTASLQDTRVEVTEPAKWVAALRQRIALDPGLASLICFKIELNAGHAGASGRYASWRDDAFELAWLISHTQPSAQT